MNRTEPMPRSAEPAAEPTGCPCPNCGGRDLILFAEPGDPSAACEGCGGIAAARLSLRCARCGTAACCVGRR
jgi:hypothetical protein